jgi:hypothetical protein
MNIAYSGCIDKGFKEGLMQIIGDSGHFKSLFSLLAAKAYMEAYKDSICVFYDSEFGSRKSYFESIGIDTTRVIHKPISNIEEFKFDIMSTIESTKKGDKVFFLVDSIGSLASKKEMEDAIDANSKDDMKRPKELNSFFRTVTPHLMIKKLPLVVINHAYQTMEFIPKTVLGGGKKSKFASDVIWEITKAQEKEAGEFAGFRFTINIHKSRFVNEKEKFPVTVLKGRGLQKYYGMHEIAEELGFIEKTKKGRSIAWKYPNDDVIYDASESNEDFFWNKILNDVKFKEAVSHRYSLESSPLIVKE